MEIDQELAKLGLKQITNFNIVLEIAYLMQ
jgi:hypothetical protein